MQLNELLDPTFHVSLAVFSGARSVYVALQNSEQIQQLTYSYSLGEIKDEDIESFVSQIIATYVEGQYFSNEIQLLAVAVLLQAKQTDYTQQTLTDFSRIRRKELPLLPKVAVLCMKSYDEISQGYNERRFESCTVITAKASSVCDVIQFPSPHVSHSHIEYDKRMSCVS